MKAISLHQPWASAIAIGLKTFETRSWATNYRGPLAIHAAKNTEGFRVFSDLLQLLPLLGERFPTFGDMPFGSIVATCEITDCLPVAVVTPTKKELILGDWGPGRFAWKLENIRAIEPIPWQGKQGFFNADIEDALLSAH